jgi:primase-polymerase (primpol)-like protein
MTIIHIPDELIALPQWLIWRYLQRPEKPKRDKVPHTTMGYRADVTNPEHWSSFESALKAVARPGFCDGIGFVFSPDDPCTGIDLDNIWQSDADEGAPWALRILERFADTYSEVSPSGKGVKIWCKAQAPRCGKWPIENGAIEVYDRARFFTVTSRFAGVKAITDHQADIEALVTALDSPRHQHFSKARVIPEVIAKGQRHNTLVSLAGSMWKRGMPAEAIEAALVITNEKQCDPPYGAGHIHKIVASMSNWRR